MLYEEKYIRYSAFSAIYLWLNLTLKWPPPVGASVGGDVPVWLLCMCFPGEESKMFQYYFQVLKTLFLDLANPHNRHAMSVLIMIKLTVVWLILLRFRELVPSSPALHLGDLWH